MDENSRAVAPSKAGSIYYFNEKFLRIQTPVQSQQKNMSAEDLSRSLVYEFNRLQREKNSKTISNGTASNWLKKKRPLHRVAMKSKKKQPQQIPPKKPQPRPSNQKKSSTDRPVATGNNSAVVVVPESAVWEVEVEIFPATRSRTSSQDFPPNLWDPHQLMDDPLEPGFLEGSNPPN